MRKDRAQRVNARARAISTRLRELLAEWSVSGDVRFVNGHWTVQLPDWYIEQRRARGVWVMDPEDYRMAHAELAPRRKDLRRCPECQIVFLADHAKQRFCPGRPCARAFNAYRTKLNRQLAAAKLSRPINRDDIRLLKTELAKLNRLAPPVKRKRP